MSEIQDIIERASPTKPCAFCGFGMPITKFQCPSCRLWNLNETENVAGAASELIRAEDVDVPLTPLNKVESTQTHRTTTGPWDDCFGGGVASESLTLIAGGPGVGKTTLLLKVLDGLLVSDYDRARYIYTEGSTGIIRDYEERLMLRHAARIDMTPPFMSFATFCRFVSSGQEPYPLVLDSSNALSEKRAFVMRMCRVLKEYNERTHAPVFMLSHINKKGDIAGIKALEHMVDTVLMMRVERNKKKEPTEFRTIQVEKSRFGPSCVIRLRDNGAGFSGVQADTTNCINKERTHTHDAPACDIHTPDTTPNETASLETSDEECSIDLDSAIDVQTTPLIDIPKPEIP
jgi:DNA repair protein RadA/Sms